MFAQEYIHQNIWATVVFSDEKTFQSSNSGRLRVYSEFFLRLAIGFYMLIFNPLLTFVPMKIFKPFLEQSWKIF
jgi:hypothetical protein